MELRETGEASVLRQPVPDGGPVGVHPVGAVLGHAAHQPVGVDVCMVNADPGRQHGEHAQVVIVHPGCGRVDEGLLDGCRRVRLGGEVHTDTHHVAGQRCLVGAITQGCASTKRHDPASLAGHRAWRERGRATSGSRPARRATVRPPRARLPLAPWRCSQPGRCLDRRARRVWSGAGRRRCSSLLTHHLTDHLWLPAVDKT